MPTTPQEISMGESSNDSASVNGSDGTPTAPQSPSRHQQILSDGWRLPHSSRMAAPPAGLADAELPLQDFLNKWDHFCSHLKMNDDKKCAFIEKKMMEREKKLDEWRRDVAEREADKEREERAAQRQAEKEDKERQERQAQREHELNVIRAKQAAGSVGGGTVVPPRRLNLDEVLPAFKPNYPLDKFLKEFETTSETWQIPEDERLRALYARLPSDLHQIIHQLPPEDRLAYKKVTETLLHACNYSIENLRRRFVEAHPHKTDTPAMYLHRKKNLLSEWLARAKVAETFEDFRDYILWDDCCRRLPSDILIPVRNELKGKVDLDVAAEEISRLMEQNHPGKRLCDVFKQPSTAPFETPIAPSGTDKGDKRKKKNGKGKSPSTTASPEVSTTSKNQSSYGQHSHQKARNPAATSHSSQRPAVSNDPSARWHSQPSKGHLRNESQGNRGSRPLARSLHSMEVEDDTATPEQGSSLGALAELGAQAKMPSCNGTINGHAVTIGLDTGAESIFVDSQYIRPEQYTGKLAYVRMAEGEPFKRKVALVQVECEFYSGVAPVIALIKPAHAMYLGRMLTLRPRFKLEDYNRAIADWNGQSALQDHALPDDEPAEMPEYSAAAVETRAKDYNEPEIPIPADISMQPLCNREEVRSMQQSDPTLKLWWRHCRKESTVSGRGGVLKTYAEQDGLLTEVITKEGKEDKRLAIPAPLRKLVMYVGHHHPLSGHFAQGKTLARVQRYFSWPKMTSDIEQYVHSCHECQLTTQRRPPPQPMGITKLAYTPFSRVAVDIVGPLEPVTRSGKRFIMTYVDMATRYPDAVALGTITSEKVAQALLEICSRVGFPEVLTTDNGSNFTSEMFQTFLKLSDIRHIRTSVYHSMGNGACERYNGTLIRCLRKLVYDFPHLWDKYLPAALFAYRDTPHETTGYAPFELIYGHQVKGPLEFLRDCWNRDSLQEEDLDIHQYILNSATKLRTVWRKAVDALKTSQTKSKALFDRHAHRRLLRPGDKVLLLLPADVRKLLLKWQGPYTVVRRYDPTHYAVSIDGHERRFHLNQLKQYQEPTPEHTLRGAMSATRQQGATPPSDQPANPTHLSELTVVHYGSPELPLTPQEEAEEYQDQLADHHAWFGEERILHLATALALEEEEAPVNDGRDPTIPTGGSQTYQDVVLAPELHTKQKEELHHILAQYQDILSDTPGRTTALEHDIILTDDKPFTHRYPMPHHLAKQLKDDLKTWLEMGIVERSSSPYCSPLLAVRKSDNTHRFCLDCRQLNARTVFDGEPIADPAHIFATLSQAKFLTKMDLASGFWQVPLSDRAKPLTAFSTREGLFHFRVMPFGLVNAPGNFSRLMRIVLGDIEDVAVYIDDILIHSPTWEAHCHTLRQVLERLRQHRLRLKPSKCEIGFRSLQYLGHVVGEGRSTPIEEKVQAITKLPLPRTVTQLRSFLGSVNYYQHYIPSCNLIARPMHDLLKGNPAKKTVLTWTDEAERAFVQLKKALTAEPVLQLVNPDLPFTLQTDASDDGLGAVLLQPRAANAQRLAPVMYASRTLKNSERHYSVIEREALAIYWACKKWEAYLYGRPFTLQTDHAPLVHLRTADKLNPRLKRWAMYLALFSFHAEHIPGEQNHLADLLSRGHPPLEEDKNHQEAAQ